MGKGCCWLFLCLFINGVSVYSNLHASVKSYLMFVHMYVMEVCICSIMLL